MELKSRYFGLEMTDGQIDLHTLDSIDEYYEVENRMKICCGSARYFNKPETLVLYIEEEQPTTGLLLFFTENSKNFVRNISKKTTIIVPEHKIPAFKPAEVFKAEVAK